MASGVLRRSLAAALLAALLPGCATRSWPEASDPGVRLEALLEEWREMRSLGLRCEDSGRHDDAVVDCGRLRNEIEAALVEFPNDVELLFAGAVLAQEASESEQAQALLDTLLSRAPGNARAAILRSQIALEDGNLAFALRLLDRSIELQPADPGLRESRAAVAYLERDWPRARRELTAAERLGAPAWRVAYHRALVAEAVGEWKIAASAYRAAIEARPEWSAPYERLRGLALRGDRQP